MLTSCSFELDERCSSSVLSHVWFPVALHLLLSLTGLYPPLWPNRGMWGLLASPASDVARLKQSRDIWVKAVLRSTPQVIGWAY